MKIKTGDSVKVITGKDAGKTGKVIQVMFNAQKQTAYVVVENVNVLKKHMRAQKKGEKGQIIELPAPIHASNVMLLDPETKKPTRVGYTIDENKNKKRIAKKTKAIID